jgi:hypothetical protein
MRPGSSIFCSRRWKSGEKLRGQPDVPAHRVKIAAVSGASAGGMVSAILCRALATGVEPVRDPLKYTETPAPDPERQTQPYRNPLFEAWVENIAIRHLLETRDLADPKQSVPSALDSTVLGRSAATCCTGPARSATGRRPISSIRSTSISPRPICAASLTAFR